MWFFFNNFLFYDLFGCYVYVNLKNKMEILKGSLYIYMLKIARNKNKDIFYLSKIHDNSRYFDTK